jgi:YD repeat-containing protein
MTARPYLRRLGALLQAGVRRPAHAAQFLASRIARGWPVPVRNTRRVPLTPPRPVPGRTSIRRWMPGRRILPLRIASVQRRSALWRGPRRGPCGDRALSGAQRAGGLAPLMLPALLLPLPLLLLARPPAHHRGVAAPLNVVVTPKDSALTTMISTNSSVVFEVSNTGSVDSAFTLSCTPSGTITSCTPQTDLLPLAGHTAEEVTVTYAASGTPGPGTLMLTAVAHNVSVPRDSGSYDFTVVGPTPTLTQPRQNDSVFNRGHCLTTDHGPFTWSCGDGMLMLTVPGITTLDKNRPLTLTYASNTADPHPLIAANVTMPASASPYTIDRIRAVLTVNDTVRRSVTYTPWSSGTKQIVLDWDATAQHTGAFYYSLVVYAVIGSDSTASTPATGITTVVNRRGGSYGPGGEWDGVERIVGNQPAGTENILWIGGDGSTMLFHQDSLRHYVAPKDGFVDTLRYNPGDSVWTLKGKYGITVHFDYSGRHTQTINRQGQVTRFFWHDFNGLDSIQLPPSSAHKTISMHYAGGLVDTIHIGNRRARLEVLGTYATRFAWPDSTYIDMFYDNAYRIDSTVDDRLARTQVTYGATSLVTALSQYYVSSTGGSATSTVHITPWQSAGFATGTTGQTPGDTAQAFTSILGPRNAGDSAEFHVDKWGAPVATFNADHQTTHYVRGDANAPGEISEIDFPNQRRAIMTYDDKANLTSMVDSSWGSDAFPTQRTTWAYLDSAELSSPSAVTAPDGTVTHFSYNFMGLTATETDPRGHITRYAYGVAVGDSLLGQLLMVTEDSVASWIQSLSRDSVRNDTTSFTYDRMGNTIRVRNPAGGISKYVRDTIMGLVTEATDPVGTHQGLVYDVMQRVVQQQQLDYLGDTTSSGCSTLEFSCNPRLTDAADTFRPARITQYFYSHGLLDGVNDPRGVRHRYVYDLRGLVAADSDEAGQVERTVYDSGGLMTSRTTRDGSTLRFGYDQSGRETQWTMPARGMDIFSIYATADSDRVTSTYDALGRLLTHNNFVIHGGSRVVHSVTRRYLANGAVSAEVVSEGGTVDHDSLGYSYDGGGRIVRRQWERGDRIDYGYDNSTGDLDSLTATWAYTGGTGSKTVGFSYDALGRRKIVRYPDNAMRDTLYYDRLGTLRRLRIINSAPTTTNRFQVTLTQDTVDLAGRVLHQRVNCDGFEASESTRGAPCGGWMPYETSSRYNRLAELVAQWGQQYHSGAEDSSAYRYDASGNRIHSWRQADGGHNVTYAYDSGSNRVRMSVDTSHKGDSLARNVRYSLYDLAGSRMVDSVEQYVRQGYQYDAAERMAGMASVGLQTLSTAPDTADFLTGDELTQFDSCRYDADGQLYRGCGTTDLKFSGSSVVRERNGDWWYVIGPGLDDPVLVIKRDRSAGDTTVRNVYPVVSDGRGQLVAIAQTDGDLEGTDLDNPEYQAGFWNSSGLTAHAQSFDPRRQSSPTPFAPISTFRNRQYDPSTGRWLQEDPIGLSGGANLYQYNGNDPNSFSDPFGLCKDKDGNDRPCAVEMSSYGRNNGESLSALAPGIYDKLLAVAAEADVDLGINAIRKGDHQDPGHAAGMAVDIGFINGHSIGYHHTTSPGMREASLGVQEAAAKLGGLKSNTGTLGPAGVFVGKSQQPTPFKNPATELEHRNHIHLSFVQ